MKVTTIFYQIGNEFDAVRMQSNPADGDHRFLFDKCETYHMVMEMVAITPIQIAPNKYEVMLLGPDKRKNERILRDIPSVCTCRACIGNGR